MGRDGGYWREAAAVQVALLDRTGVVAAADDLAVAAVSEVIR